MLFRADGVCQAARVQRHALSLAAGLTLLLTTACGGSEEQAAEQPARAQTNEAPASPSPVRTTNSSSPAPTAGNDSCSDPAGDGGALDLTSVALERSGDGIRVTWTTASPPPASGSVLYSVTAARPDGSTVQQFGLKYQDGQQIGFFVFNFGSANQENLEGQVDGSGTTVTALFDSPSVGDLGEQFRWQATTGVDGGDVDDCPDGDARQQFTS